MTDPHAPDAVRWSALWWFAALGAGLVETALGVLGGSVTGPALFALVTLRAVITVALGWVVLQLHAGRPWARWCLAVLLSGFGTLSLVYDPVIWLITGGDPYAALIGLDVATVVFAAVRVLHVVAVVAATVLMFVPATHRYLHRPRYVAASPSPLVAGGYVPAGSSPER